jgi:putative transposase
LTFVHHVQIVAAQNFLSCPLLRLEVGMGINHSSRVEVYLHIVWATWDRLRLLSPAVRERVYLCMREEASRLKAEMIAIGGIEDHVHVLLRLPATISIADLVKQLKGSSSHLANHEVLPRGFKWQGGYSASSVSRRAVPKVQDYVLRQEEHHRDGNTFPGAEP